MIPLPKKPGNGNPVGDLVVKTLSLSMKKNICSFTTLISQKIWIFLTRTTKALILMTWAQLSVKPNFMWKSKIFPDWPMLWTCLWFSSVSRGAFVVLLKDCVCFCDALHIPVDSAT